MKQLEVLQSKLLPLSSLRANAGQIPGLPANPRSIDSVQLARLKKSLKANPEMMALREILVYQYNGQNVVIGGNQRLQALQGLNIGDVPCKIIPQGTKPKQLRAYLIKDNIAFGEWVDEMLSAEWDMKELDDFGMDDVESISPSEPFQQEIQTSDEVTVTPVVSLPDASSRKNNDEQILTMKVGVRNYLVSKEDADAFLQRADAYNIANGTYAGFVTSLFN